MTTYVLIDVPNLSHRNYYGMLNAASANRAINGLFRDIVFLVDVLAQDKFVFCFDGEDPARRVAYPEYKANRMRNEHYPSIQRQIKDLKDKWLPKAGFKNLFYHPTLEADDWVGFLCQNKCDSFIIVSNDTDYYQLLEGDRVTIWNVVSKWTINEERFRSIYKFGPKDWIRYKAMIGCKTDNIKGVAGEISASAFLRGVPVHTHYLKKITEGEDIIERNVPLVTIPYPNYDPLISLQPFQKDEVTPEKWEQAISEMKYDHLLNKYPFKREPL